LNGVWSRKPNNNQPAWQPDLGQICFSQWGNRFYIQSRKEQLNQQSNCTAVVQILAEGYVGHYPLQKQFLGFGWEVTMALLCV